MKYHKIILAGGNGYLGIVLANHYKTLAEEIVILSRRPEPGSNPARISGSNPEPGPGNDPGRVSGKNPGPAQANIRTLVWDGKTEGDWKAALENADLLVNLCGKNVNCRYTDKNQKEIIRSRTVPTALLGRVIAGLSAPPKLWINVTSATIYRHAEDHGQDEQTGEIGTGFSIDVCKRWEKVFFLAQTPRTRKVALRMGIVLGQADGVFPRLLNLVKCGLGGKQGNGRQYVSWIHEADAARITEWLMDHPQENGVINCTAPHPVKNVEQMRLIRQAYGRSWGLPAPGWLLAIGALLIGTETELILKSRWVLPQRLLDAGFVFEFPDINEAIQACIP